MVGSESDTDSGSESASTSDEDDSTSEDGPASEDGESDAESARSAAAKAGKEREAVEDKAQPTGPIDGHLEAQGRAAAAAASDDLAAEPTTREKASVMLAAATDEEDEREGEPPEVKRARRALRAAQRREEEEARRSAALTAELSALSSRVGKLALTSSTLAAGLEPAAAAAAMREAISAEAGALRAQAVLDEVALARRHDTAVEADGDSAGAEAVAAAAMRAAAERERSEGAAARRRAAEARLAREKATEARRQAATAEYDQQQRQVEVAIIALHKTPHSEFVLRGVFEAHDLKGSGILSASEVRAALGELGLKQGSAENDMNSLSLSGFISLARELKRSQPDPRLPSVGTGAAFGVAIGDSEEGEGSEESGESGESETESEETEESDGESSSEESDEEDEEGKREREGNTARPPPTMLGIGAWAKSAAELRSHYARAGLVALQAQLLAEREAVSNRMALACDEAPGYRGQLGSSTYRPSQLDAFKLCRVLAEELVSEIVEAEILSKPERSEEELSKELRSWKRQHARLRNKLARRKKGASPASLTPDGGTAKDAPAGTAADRQRRQSLGMNPRPRGRPPTALRARVMRRAKAARRARREARRKLPRRGTKKEGRRRAAMRGQNGSPWTSTHRPPPQSCWIRPIAWRRRRMGSLGTRTQRAMPTRLVITWLSLPGACMLFCPS